MNPKRLTKWRIAKQLNNWVAYRIKIHPFAVMLPSSHEFASFDEALSFVRSIGV